jgi:tetratricopeptide (TPR) repeat protein
VFCRGLRSLSSFTILLVLGVLVFGALSCSRGRKPAVERIAVVGFENLSSNIKLNWASRAIASALVYDLTPSADLHAQTVDSTSGAYTNDASEMLEGYFSESSGQLKMTATLESLGKTKTVASFELGGPASAGVLPLVNQLAKRLNAAARPFGTNKEEVFRAYGKALEGATPEAIADELKTATEADPHFALGYLIWARLLAAEGQREPSVKILQAGRAANPDAIDTAEMDYVAASIASDVDGRVKALETLSRLAPADVNWLRELAGLRLAQRRFQEAARNYEAATRLDGEDAELWNQLGYAYAFEQDLASANRALEHYEQMLGPENSNALDSLGEVNFFLGDFSEAEKYFLEAQEKAGARRGEELVKAAESRLMMGDLAGADGIFEKYLALAQLRQKQAAGFERAQWEFMTGRCKAGMARLEQMIPALDQDQQSLGWSQLSIWKMQTGEEGAAAEMAEKAATLAQSPRARNASALCREIALARSNAGGTSAVALLFARKFSAAAPLLEATYRGTSPTLDGQIRTFLAWAEEGTGHLASARPLLQAYPLPLSSGDPVLASMVFPRFLFLRGMVLQNDGKRADAKKSFELFLKYAGNVPDVFGDEAAARKGLGAGG